MTAQTAVLQALLGAPGCRPLVARLSDVVPRTLVRDLVADIRALREAQDEARDEDSPAAQLLTRVHDQAAAIAYPDTSTPPATAAVLVVLPGAAELAELLRLAINAADREIEGGQVDDGAEDTALFVPLVELAPDDTDRLVLEAGARHLHALITTGVLADPTGETTTETTTETTELEEGVRS